MWTKLRSAGLALIALVAFGFSNAKAQPADARLAANPFLSAEEILVLRSETQAAPRSYTYLERVTQGEETTDLEITITAANDWALVVRGEMRLLYDFALSRIFELPSQDSFVSTNLLHSATWRVTEYQYRQYLSLGLAAAGGAVANLITLCDIQTELGVVLPSQSTRARTEVHGHGDTRTIRCDNETVGGFTLSDAEPPPAAFWPALADTATMHPVQWEALADTGRAPQIASASIGGVIERRIVYTLQQVTETATPYPLARGARNLTAETFEESGPGLSALATAAVAGQAAGGPPTPASVAAAYDAIVRERGEAIGAWEFGVIGNTLPLTLESCQRGASYSFCAIFSNLARLAQEDQGLRSAFQIIIGEQEGDFQSAMMGMQGALQSPLRDHPAVGASWALAIRTASQEEAAEAAAAGLPTDAPALTRAGIAAYPYNPGYWLDYGDYFLMQYDMRTAFYFFDVGFYQPV